MGADAASYLDSQCTQDLSALGVGGEATTFVLSPSGEIVSFAIVRRTSALRLELGAGRDGGAAWGAPAPLRDPLRRRGARRGAVHGRRPAAQTSGLGSRRCVPGATELARGLVVHAMSRELLERCVSFTKGCYPGQELVARIESRGATPPYVLRGLSSDVALTVGDAMGEERFDGAVTSVSPIGGRRTGSPSACCTVATPRARPSRCAPRRARPWRGSARPPRYAQGVPGPLDVDRRVPSRQVRGGRAPDQPAPRRGGSHPGARLAARRAHPPGGRPDARSSPRSSAARRAQGSCAPTSTPPPSPSPTSDGGAAAISVLTDGPHFGGSPGRRRRGSSRHCAAGPAQGLHRLRRTTSPTPARMGASGVLLIAAILSKPELRALLEVADHLGLDRARRGARRARAASARSSSVRSSSG